MLTTMVQLWNLVTLIRGLSLLGDLGSPPTFAKNSLIPQTWKNPPLSRLPLPPHQIFIPSPIMCTPCPFLQGGLCLQPNFQKGGGGVSRKTNIEGGGLPKKGGLGYFAYLRGGLARKRGVVFLKGGGWYPMHTMSPPKINFLPPHPQPSLNKSFQVITQ